MSQNQNLTDLEQLRQQTLLDTCKEMRELCNEILSVVVNFPGANPNLPAQVNQLFRVRATLEQVDALYGVRCASNITHLCALNFTQG